MKQDKPQNNILAILSLIALIITIFLSSFWPDQDNIKMGALICTTLSLITFIFGIIARKQIKKSNEKGIKITLVSLIFGAFLFITNACSLLLYNAIEDIEFNDQYICQLVTNCTDNFDGTSTCYMSDVYEIPCSTDFLTEEQFK